MIQRIVIYLWIAITMVFALLRAPLVPVLEETTRVLYFHIPAAWVTVLALGWSMIHSALYLWKRDLRHDDHASAAAELGFLFCVVATISGSIWAKAMWGSYWNWDPRETSIFFVLLLYGAYLALRGSIEGDERRMMHRFEHPTSRGDREWLVAGRCHTPRPRRKRRRAPADN